MQTLKLADIKIDGGTQPRVAINNALVDEYSEAMLNGDDFPAMGVVFDGSEYWLYDGFHRYHAAVKAELDSFRIDVTKGTVMNARWLSVTTNRDHGLRRTNEDKQKAVKIALKMKPDMSDRMLAQHCGVSPSTVGNTRKQVSKLDTSPQKTTKREGLDGNAYKIPPVPAPLEEVKKPVDKLGRNIPDVCMGIWDRRGEIQEYLTMLSKIRSRVNKAFDDRDVLFGNVNDQTLKASLDRAYGSMKTAMPYAVCPMCQGHGSCRVCKDKGMVSQFMWNTAIARETKADIDRLIKEQK
jgi:hypothetical protein